MKTPSITKLSTDIALALKDVIISTIPKKSAEVAPMQTLMWIHLLNVAKKIHTLLFFAPKEISLSLSVFEELALYEFLMRDKEKTLISLDPIFLDFIKSVDEKIKANIFLTQN